MPRRIQPIFDSILADARLQGSSRSFVESLQAQYTRKKTLSQGQRRALARIEDTIANAPTVDIEEQTRLDNLISRAQEAGDRWATDFVTSLKGQVLLGRDLSARQKEILKKIEDRHSDEAKQLRESWASNFSSEMREKLKIAAQYYLANPPYFGDIAKKALEDDSYVPSERSYRKMVENKYATKVIAATQAEPKFKVGSHVQLRSNAPTQRFMTGVTAVVLKTDSKPVTSPARGSKVYSLLFFGKTEAVHIEERWLKKAKR
jgi:hypothetical protein